MKFPPQHRADRSLRRSQRGERYPLVIMLEPTLGCNIACIGCGKIREYESNKARLTVEECLHSAVECPAPSSRCAAASRSSSRNRRRGRRLPRDEAQRSALHERASPGRPVPAEPAPDVRRPSRRHEEIRDYICDYPGLWDVAVDAIKTAREAGFRVTTNTTIFKETSIEDVIEMMEYLTSEIGIDGMLVAPGYQYSQIDPNLTMTRSEHEDKFGRSAWQSGRGLPLARQPGLPGLPNGRAQASMRAVGVGDAQPVRLEGPVLSLDGRDLPDVRGTHGRSRMGTVRARQRPSLRALRHSLGLRAVRDDRNHLESQGVGAKSRVDAPLTLACALAVEEKVARKAGARAARVSLGARLPLPEGPLVSFGFAAASTRASARARS